VAENFDKTLVANVALFATIGPFQCQVPLLRAVSRNECVKNWFQA